MLLDRGTYCVFVTAVMPAGPDQPLPALKVVAAPDSSSVAIGSLPGDGWLRHVGDAVLIRIVSQSAKILLTSYDDGRIAGAKPPQIELKRLDRGAQGLLTDQKPSITKSGLSPDVTVHFQRHGDVAGNFGQWLSVGDGDTWIEGIEFSPLPSTDTADIEYQVVLGRGWLSPWVRVGEFCGSRGMGLPVLGFRARVVGPLAEDWRVSYSARCIDGRELAEVEGGMACEAQELVPLSALKINLTHLRSVPVGTPIRKSRAKAPVKKL
jgi:hypothetical protein